METIKINPVEIKTKIVDAQGNELVPIVRCKDCKWFHVHKTAVWCEKEEGLYHPQYDSFCSWGKKKEDG